MLTDRIDTEDSTQSDPNFNSGSANDEPSESDEAFGNSLQGNVRSLTDRSAEPKIPAPEESKPPETDFAVDDAIPEEKAAECPEPTYSWFEPKRSRKKW